MLLLGKISKPIRKGARALDRVGDALKSFAVGLAGFALVTFFILMQPAILIGMVASLVLIGGAVALIGLVDKQIKTFWFRVYFLTFLSKPSSYDWFFIRHTRS